MMSPGREAGSGRRGNTSENIIGVVRRDLSVCLLACWFVSEFYY